jgi:hypothetical protein
VEFQLEPGTLASGCLEVSLRDMGGSGGGGAGGEGLGICGCEMDTTWRWRFKGGFTGGIISRILGYVVRVWWG